MTTAEFEALKVGDVVKIEGGTGFSLATILEKLDQKVVIEYEGINAGPYAITAEWGVPQFMEIFSL